MTLRRVGLLAVAAIWAAGVCPAGPMPEPFRGHDPNSRFTINYGDVDAILNAMVVMDRSRSVQEVAVPSMAPTGTRMNSRISRSTSREGNRFRFEAFQGNEAYRVLLRDVRRSLEAIPSSIAMEHFSRTEQLAYWLNLHNITLIDELLRVYPERNLKQELQGKDGILDEKVLNVAGISLSLNDIRHTILVQNYNSNPLVLFGLFEGTFGGPDIRNAAYTGENVRRHLENNARAYINSNRGAVLYKSSTFSVSGLYERNREYFPRFEADLKVHLMRYMGLPERRSLRLATAFKPNIDNWTIADVQGGHQRIGGSFSTSRAAMLDAVISTQSDGQGGTVGTGFSVADSSYIANTAPPGAIDYEQLELLNSLKNREQAADLVREGRITIKAPGGVEAASPNRKTE